MAAHAAWSADNLSGYETHHNKPTHDGCVVSTPGTTCGKRLLSVQCVASCDKAYSRRLDQPFVNDHRRV